MSTCFTQLSTFKISRIVSETASQASVHSSFFKKEQLEKVPKNSKKTILIKFAF